MAKHTPLNVSTLFAATMAAVLADGDEAACIEAGSLVLANASLDECVDSFITGETSERASRAGKKAALIKARELLDADGVDVTDAAAMVEVLWPSFWRKAGGKGAPSKGKTDESARFWDRNHKAAERMAKAIALIDAAEVPGPRVPREAQEAANLLVAYEAKVQKEAMKRARDAAKKAKAKAAKAAKAE